MQLLINGSRILVSMMFSFENLTEREHFLYRYRLLTELLKSVPERCCVRLVLKPQISKFLVPQLIYRKSSNLEGLKYNRKKEEKLTFLRTPLCH